MRTKLLLFTGLLLAQIPAFAQSSLAIKAGPTLAHFSGTGAQSVGSSTLLGSFRGDRRNIIGYSVGLSYNAAINNVFSFNPEFLVVQTGNRVEYSGSLLGSNFDGYQSIRLTYVQLPLLFRLNLTGESYQLYANIGPYLGYTFDGSIKTESNGGGTSRTETRDIDYKDDNISRLDLGISAGIGAGFKAGPGLLGLDLRFQQGITRIEKDKPENDPNTSEDESDDVRFNQLFTPSLFYAIRF